MEGPTPSSAIFYGALSVHAGAFLLLRLSPILERAPLAAGLLVGLGLLTSLHATLVGRAQTDIKSALAYASLTQVGLVWVEIGLGLDRLALAHIVGHGCLRSLQFLRTPSLLHDFHRAEDAVGGHLAHTGAHLERWLPPAAQRWLYRLALERAYLDDGLDEWVLRPLFAGLRRLDGLERRLAARFDGAPRARSGRPSAAGRGAP
jgi:NAD(P)H-quinone oxidoreductase subunit 5